MYDFAPTDELTSEERYRQLGEAASALIENEPDPVANMANIAALLWEFIPRINWAGFYRVIEGELVLGPFIGRPACIRIPFGEGVCGTAASTGETQLVADVHAFPGHISCDAVTQSEVVVPVFRDGKVIAVIDCDSPDPARFEKADARGLEALTERIANRI